MVDLIQTPDANAAAPAVVATPVRKKQVFERIPAIGMKPPLFNETEEGMEYSLVYVSPQGKQCIIRCTENVWRDVQQSQLSRKPRHDFVLLKDRAEEIVTQITMHLKRDFGIFDLATDTEAGASPASKYVEVVIDPEGTVSIKNRPADITHAVEDVILSSLRTDGAIRSGDYIDGSYRVDEVRERDGFRTAYVDPRPMT
jgi:hypothetical protein